LYPNGSKFIFNGILILPMASTGVYFGMNCVRQWKSGVFLAKFIKTHGVLFEIILHTNSKLMEF
jgi:hypothetical protein